MRFEKFSFGSIRIDGSTYDHDVVIDRGEVRRRKKKPSKEFRDDHSEPNAFRAVASLPQMRTASATGRRFL